jgi:DNA replication protein DnaC
MFTNSRKRGQPQYKLSINSKYCRKIQIGRALYEIKKFNSMKNHLFKPTHTPIQENFKPIEPPKQKTLVWYDEYRLVDDSVVDMHSLIQIMNNDGCNVYYSNDYLDLYGNSIYGYCLVDPATLIAPTDYWERLIEFREHSHNIASYTVREGSLKACEHVKPSDALKSLLNGHSIIDCGIAVQISVYYYLINTIGKKQFDKLFQRCLTPFTLTQDITTQLIYQKTPKTREQFDGYSLHFLFDVIYTSIDHVSSDLPTMEKGDLVYFAGVEEHSRKHLASPFQGFNLIMTSSTHCIGFDTSFFKEPKTFKELEQYLIERYNENPSGHSNNHLQKLKNSIVENPNIYNTPKYLSIVSEAEHLMYDKYNPIKNKFHGIITIMRLNKTKLAKFINDTNNNWINTTVDHTFYEKSTRHFDGVQNNILYYSPIAQESKNNTFETFKIDGNTQKQNLHDVVIKFSKKVVEQTHETGPLCLILSGNPGIGKSHLCVSAMKLISGFKKVIYITENYLRINDIKCTALINVINRSKIDLVCFDDVNNRFVFYEYIQPLITEWMTSSTSKALLINSNVINNNIFHEVIPFFVDYTHPWSHNFQVYTDKTIKSFRSPWCEIETHPESNENKLNKLLNYDGDSGAGIIINDWDPKHIITHIIKNSVSTPPKIEIVADHPDGYFQDTSLFRYYENDINIIYIHGGYLNNKLIQFEKLLIKSFENNKKMILCLDTSVITFSDFKKCLMKHIDPKFLQKMTDRLKVVFPCLTQLLAPYSFDDDID